MMSSRPDCKLPRTGCWQPAPGCSDRLPPRRSTGGVQARQRPGAGTEPVRVDAQALEHAHVEVRQRRRVARVESQVLAVPEAAAGEDDRQVPRRVATGVAEVAAEE